MNKSIFFLISPILIISPFITLSINSWLRIWISIEINFIAYIPLIIFLNKYNKNISNKYFITQSIRSTFFLSSIYFDFLINSNYINFITSIKYILFNFRIFIKLGIPPFQNWFIDLINNINWINCIILSNWQKIIPIIILNHIYSLTIIYISIILCLLITPLGLNFSSTHLIIRFSSINQIGWILLIIPSKEIRWKWYFTLYLISNSSIILFFNKFNIKSFNQLNNLNNYLTIYLLIILIFSIRGIPPFLGFLIKLLTIKNFLKSPIILLFIIISIFTFIMYTRLCYKIILKTFIINKLTISIKFFSINLIEIIIFSLPIWFWLISFNWSN